MTADEFRQLALSFDGAVEGSHMGHPDFRVNGKIFATLAPDLTWGCTMLMPDQQSDLRDRYPECFEPASGKWGDGGATKILLSPATPESAGEALTFAYQNKR